MSKKSLFSKAFDDGTKAKLEIFRLYLKEWLPVFISSYEKKFWDTIFIYDFFAGEGKDSEGSSGSPLIILEVLNEFSDLVNNSSVKIKVILNEKDINIYGKLESNIQKKTYNRDKINVELYNHSFQDFFNVIYPKMVSKSELPRLMFLDQYGIKEITKEIFLKLISFKRTDFIFFISSSFIRRFNELDEFRTYIAIEKEKFEESKPFHSHRVVFNYYKSLINTEYRLAPFSIQKERNIYGLIFGSNHTLGLEKFLSVAWKINPNTGDANFNIDEEKIIIGELSLFEEYNTIKKIALFEKKLKDKILNKKILKVNQAYIFTLEFGCQPKHCTKVIKDLINENKIEEVKTLNQKIHNLAPGNLFNIKRK